MSDTIGAAESASMSARIREAVHAAASAGMTRNQLRDLCRAMPDFPRFEGAMTYLVRCRAIVRRGVYNRAVYYGTEALAEAAAAAARTAAASAPAGPARPEPADRRPGWETIHRTPTLLKQPPARVPPPTGQVVWPEGVKVTVCPSPPAHSRYYVPPETVGAFTLEWRRLRKGGAGAKGVGRG